MQVFPSYLPIYCIISRSQARLSSFYELVAAYLVPKGLRVARVDARIAEGMGGTENSGSLFQSRTKAFPAFTCVGSKDSVCLQLWRLSRKFDILLLENCDEFELPRLLLDTACADSTVAHFNMQTFEENGEAAVSLIMQQLVEKLAMRPVWACILIGGKSSRMGQPKHLLTDKHGMTWLERTVRTVQPHVSGIALSGQGEIPFELTSLVRLPDLPDVAGPLTGILSAMRWQPDIAWLLLACDMPEVTEDAVIWLLAQKKIGRWGSVPALAGAQRVEPLFARYEPSSAAYFEQIRAAGIRRISHIVDFEKIAVLQVPDTLSGAWKNVNTPEELQRPLPHFFSGSL